MGYIPNVQFAPYYIAMEKGYFEKERLEVSFDYGMAIDIMSLVANGVVDFGVSDGDQVIIAREKKTLVFVEVKSRRSIRYGNPKWAVTPKKQRKISMVALSYLKTTKQSDARARFDVVAITSNHDEPQIEIIKNAFDLAYE